MKKKFPYEEALKIAEAALAELRPHCVRAEIAGSIRRKKSECGDIEIVAIPKPYKHGLFEDGMALVVNKWKKVKGEMEYGKTRYTQRILPEGIALDLFICKEENWGNIFAMRTGSADYSHKILASGWKDRWYVSIDVRITKDGEEYDLYDEEDLFRLVGIPYVDPEYRNL